MTTLTNLSWQPTTTLAAMKLRAKLYADIRQFFAARGVMEVDTPSLSQHTVTDLYIQSFKTAYIDGEKQQYYYLQTSPEYAMKRLLAAGSGPIYQICKAFRNGERGNKHNPEFTMIEWYRPGFNDHALMQDVDDFLQHTLQTAKSQRMTYQQLFIKYLNIEPYTCPITELQNIAKKSGLHTDASSMDHDALLQFLFGEIIEPQIGFDAPMMVYDFPLAQAALAKIRPGNPPVAERFEVYIQGIELANGFHELTRADEQYQRFQRDQQRRQQAGYPAVEIDERFIAALQSGLPACAGVALGIDRLLMIKAKTLQIKDIINFPWEIA
jgi:lysyl-tRNA synthetase class 2